MRKAAFLPATILFAVVTIVMILSGCSMDQVVEEAQADQAKPQKVATQKAATQKAATQKAATQKPKPAARARSAAQKRPAMSFELKNLDGQTVSLDDYKGKLVMINFWAHWCGPCIHEIPDLVKLRNNYKDKGFEILGIVVPSGMNERKIRETQNRLRMDYPILIGDMKMISKFGQINSIPTTFLINRSGKVVDRVIGARPYATFEAMIKPHLEG